ncbi:hypothetical protein ACWEBX_27350 [Streptomyces sp. NPDC005070]
MVSTVGWWSAPWQGCPAQNRYADPAAWDCLEAEFGIRLPAD